MLPLLSRQSRNIFPPSMVFQWQWHSRDTYHQLEELFKLPMECPGQNKVLSPTEELRMDREWSSLAIHMLECNALEKQPFPLPSISIPIDSLEAPLPASEFSMPQFIYGIIGLSVYFFLQGSVRSYIHFIWAQVLQVFFVQGSQHSFCFYSYWEHVKVYHSLSGGF